MHIQCIYIYIELRALSMKKTPQTVQYLNNKRVAENKSNKYSISVKIIIIDK